jgi:hypothetical protein
VFEFGNGGRGTKSTFEYKGRHSKTNLSYYSSNEINWIESIILNRCRKTKFRLIWLDNGGQWPRIWTVWWNKIRVPNCDCFWWLGKKYFNGTHIVESSLESLPEVAFNSYLTMIIGLSTQIYLYGTSALFHSHTRVVRHQHKPIGHVAFPEPPEAISTCYAHFDSLKIFTPYHWFTWFYSLNYDKVH